MGWNTLSASSCVKTTLPAAGRFNSQLLTTNTPHPRLPRPGGSNAIDA